MAEGPGEAQAGSPSFSPDYGEEAEGNGEPEMAAVRAEIKAQETESWTPERVRFALERSRSMDEYRANRPFRFLHLFSGEKDMLSEALKKEYDRAHLKLYAEGIDRKVDAGVDLTSPDTFDGIDKSIEDGDWDAVHSGFPCSSFSMVVETGAGRPPTREERLPHLRTARQHRLNAEGGRCRYADGSAVGVGAPEAGGGQRQAADPGLHDHGEPAGQRHLRISVDATRDGGRIGRDKVVRGGVQHVRLPV